MATEAGRLSQRLRGYTATLLDLLRNRPPTLLQLARALSEVGRISGAALNVQRTSVWLFTDEGERLACRVLICDGREEPTSDVWLRTADSPAYFNAIRKAGVVAVEDALTDSRTAELTPYLREKKVRSLLDISIAIPGELLGVVCHEHTGSPRIWQPEEIDFATHVGDLVALALEVERRKLAEARALGTEAKYRYLVESLPVTVYSFDAFSRKLEYLSPQIHELGAFQPGDALDDVNTWLALIHPQDRPMVEARFAPGGVDRVPAEIQYRIVLRDGSLRYVRDHCRVVRNHLGHPVAIQGVLADITEQRRAEQRNLELERRMRTLLEHMDLLALVLDTQGRAEFVNECFERTTGYRASEVLGADCFALLVPPSEADATREQFREGLARGTLAARFEHEITTRQGDRRRIVWSNTILRAENGTPEGTCSLGLDITERLRLEGELLQHSKLESLGELSAGIAHDFNNILMVMGYQIEQLGAETDPKLKGVLLQSLQQAEDLTRSLLVYSRKEPVSPSAVDVDGLIEELAPLLSAFNRQKLELKMSLKAPQAEVVIDPSQLRQMLINLVGNALEATAGYGKQVCVSTSVERCDETFARRHGATRGGAFVVVVVRDDGRGIDSATLGRIFEPFFTTKEKGKGTGLGLAMSQSIVARAGGFITAHSEPGRGSEFRVYLPVRSREGEDKRELRAPASAMAASAARALLIGDDVALREQIAAELSQVPLSVRRIESTRGAVRLLASEDFELLVLCETKADPFARVLARSARAARPELRLLLVSTFSQDDPEFDATLRLPAPEGRARELAELLLQERRSQMLMPQDTG